MATRVILSYADYAAIPNDGRRYEVHDGELSVTPAPSPRHQEVVGNLFVLLTELVRASGLGKVFVSPIDCILSDTTIVQPDLVYLGPERLTAVSGRGIEGPPTLVVEVLSPSTLQIDRSVKGQLYAKHRVPHYWIVDTDCRSIEAFSLAGEGYRPAGRLEGSDPVGLPPLDELRLDPAALRPRGDAVRPPFAHHRPTTVEEACRLLALEPRATVLAGGTDLMVHLRQPWRGKRPPAVVNLKRIPELARIEVGDRAIRLGALVTLTDLIEHPVLRAEYPVLAFTARYMGSPAIRNLATVGGNLCNASPAADLPPVLLVLDAEVGIVGLRGERRLRLDELFRGPGQTALGAGELLAWVEFPRRHGGWAIRYERLDVRRAMDIAIAGVALALRIDTGRVAEARVALCAVAPTALRVPVAETVLVGGGLSGPGIARAAELAMIATRPIGDVRASAEYRREMVGALVIRGLERIARGDAAGTRGAA